MDANSASKANADTAADAEGSTIALCECCSSELKIDRLYRKMTIEVIWPSQPNGVITSMAGLPNHTFTGQD